MSRFFAFSDHDLELLVADLLHAEDGVPYEVFPRGRDLGIDLRHVSDGAVQMVQVKHYERSSLSSLKRAAKDEVAKLRALDTQPTTYRFVTSFELSVAQKDDIVAMLAPYVRGPQDVVGGVELAQRVGAREEVERRHPKLWLASGAHLSEMVNSGTRTRSRALIVEIEAALPHYVRHTGFAEARRRLHDGRVLIIAGDPGVGKTTLANILVADAVRSSYDEPVQVLRDIEEAWRVFEPSRRQIVLYDDFLGRTALQRMAKNEDRSLSSFMREVVAAPHTLFILTTREYILRHAQQVHLALGDGRVEEQHFLLHLRQYSLLDRAHIFVNHAYHSGQLSRRARASLLENDAWRRIVEHPNYNPRSISFITGMAGRRLRADELDDYVTFAEGVLDDPSRLWRETFRQELDAQQRTLLLAVSAMPDDAELDDLRRAFDGISREVGREGGRESFDESMRALDDSMLASHEEDRMIFVRTRDPSVRDYLTEHLARTPEHARTVLRGAVAWEQVLWVARHALGSHVDELRADFASASDRLIDAKPVTFTPVHWFDDPDPTLTRSSNDLALRLNELREVHEKMPQLVEAKALHDARLSRYFETLGEGDIHRRSALDLLRDLRDEVVGIPQALDAARRYFTSSLTYPVAWQQLRAFRKLFPQLFTDGDWLALGRACHDWAESELADTDELRGTEDVNEIAYEAEEMGMPVADELVDHASSEVRDRDGYDDERVHDDPQLINRDDLSLTDQTAQARALIERLAVEPPPPARSSQ